MSSPAAARPAAALAAGRSVPAAAAARAPGAVWELFRFPQQPPWRDHADTPPTGCPRAGGPLWAAALELGHAAQMDGMGLNNRIDWPVRRSRSGSTRGWWRRGEGRR